MAKMHQLIQNIESLNPIESESLLHSKPFLNIINCDLSKECFIKRFFSESPIKSQVLCLSVYSRFYHIFFRVMLFFVTLQVWWIYLTVNPCAFWKNIFSESLSHAALKAGRFLYIILNSTATVDRLTILVYDRVEIFILYIRC